jgi:hypothetical protein
VAAGHGVMTQPVAWGSGYHTGGSMPSTLAALKAAIQAAQQSNLQAAQEAAEIRAEMKEAGIL